MNAAFVFLFCATLIFAQPTASAPVGAPPPAHAWPIYIPVIFGFIQFLFLSALTIFVFLSNATQKIKERQAEWYHKVVVDHAVDELKGLFGKMQEELLNSAECIDVQRHDDPESALEASKRAIGKAKGTIFQLRSEMGFRLSAFDSALELLFTQELESLENEIVAWFTTQSERRCYDASTSLPAILVKAQVRLLHVLMQKEFSTWGLTWPWSSKGLLPPKESALRNAR